MEHASPISAWESYYVIVGSSAAALTGLQFVVITLIGERQAGGALEVKAFGTPTVVHFCAALLISALLSAPWSGVRSAGTALLCIGVAGLVYTAIVTRRARMSMRYKPVLEDWIWHVVLPFVAYGVVLVCGIELPRVATGSLFGVAGAALLLVFIGIHNAWDTVTYVAVERAENAADGEKR